MKRAFIALSLVVSAVSLSACGESTGDRALSGGAIGALTDSKQIDLGKPVWR